MIESWWKIESSIKFLYLLHMLQQKSTRESLSFKRNEYYIVESRDYLCQHYKLNKSDLMKYLIKKETQQIKNLNSTIGVIWKTSSHLSTMNQPRRSSNLYAANPTWHQKIFRHYWWHYSSMLMILRRQKESFRIAGLDIIYRWKMMPTIKRHQHSTISRSVGIIDFLATLW